MFVSRLTGEANYRLLSGQNNGQTGANWLLGFWGGRKDVAHLKDSSGFVTGTTTSADTGPYLYEAVIPDGGTTVVYRNGTQIGSSTAAMNGPAGLRVGGGYVVNGSEHSSGEIAELLVYSSVLSDADRRQVEEYLMKKWGLGALPDGGDVTVAASTTLDVNGSSQDLGALNGEGTVINSEAGTTVSLITGTDDKNGSFSGVIGGGAGTIALNKSGTGTLTLSGSAPNVYAGLTTLSEGYLELSKTTGPAIPGDFLGHNAKHAGGLVVYMLTDNQFSPDSVIRFTGTSADHVRFELMGTDQTVAGIDNAYSSGKGVIQVREQAPVAGVDGTSTLTLTGAGDYWFDAYLRNTGGTLGLRKTGSGMQTLSGTAIDYMGATTVSNGTLHMLDLDDCHSSMLTIASGATAEFSNSTRGFNRFTDTSIEGDGTFVKSGTSTLTTGNSGGYARWNMTGGWIDVQGGVFKSDYQDQNVAWVNNKASMNVAAGAFVSMVGGNHISVDALTGAGTVQNINNWGTGIFTVGQNDGSGIFDGMLKDNGGPLALKKVGAGTQTLGNASTYGGGTTIGDGTLEVSASGALGSGAVANNAALRFNDAGVCTIDNAISGTGTVMQAGSGTLTLGGTNDYTGDTTVSAGRLNVAGTLGTTTVSVASGAAIGGEGSMAGQLTLADGSTLRVDAATVTNALSVGDLDISAGTISLYLDPTPTPADGLASYRVLNYSGNLTGDASNVELLPSTGYRSLSLTDGGGQVNLEYSAYNLTWTGDVDGTWDIDGTDNWTPQDRFFNGDSVTFTDAGVTKGVTLDMEVAPSAVTFNNSVGNDYTLSGSGSIVGASKLTKSGDGTLTLSSANSFSGGAGLGYGGTNGGIVRLVHEDALGSGTLTMNGAQLQAALGGLTIPNAVAIDGGGFRFGGTNDLTFAGDVDLMGANRGIGSYSAGMLTLSGTISGGGYGIVKEGTGPLTLSGASTYSGTTTLLDGTLALSGGNNRLPTGSTFAFAGSRTLDLGNTTQSVAGLTMVAGIAPVISGSGGELTAGGTVTLKNNDNLTIANGASMIIPGTMKQANNVTTTRTVDGELSVGTYYGAAKTANYSSHYCTLNVNAGAEATFGTMYLAGNGYDNYGTLQDTINISGMMNVTTMRGWLISGSGGLVTVNRYINVNAGGRLNATTINLGLGSDGNNTHNRRLTLNNGTLANGVTGNLSVDNTTEVRLQNNPAVDVSSGRTATISGVVSQAGNLTKTGEGTLTLANGANTFSGNIVVSSGVIKSGTTSGSAYFGARSSSRTITVNDDGTLEFDAPGIFGGHDSVTVPHLIVNTGVVTCAGSVVNNPLNAVTLNDGTLTAAGDNGAMWRSWNLNGTITSTGNSLIAAGTTANPGALLKSAGGSPWNTIMNVADGTLTVSAPLLDGRDGAGAFDAHASGLVAQGGGTLLLTGENTYTGPTTVQGGTVTVDGSLVANIDVQDGLLNGSGTLNWRFLGNTADQIRAGVNGALDLSGLTLNLVNAGGIDREEYVVIDDKTKVTNRFAAVLNVPTGWALAYDGTPSHADSVVLSLDIDAATTTWSGDDASESLWSTVANWVDDKTPVEGGALVFPVTADRKTCTNDSTIGVAYSLSLGGGYTLAGDRFSLDGFVSSANDNALGLGLTLNGNNRFRVTNGTLTVSEIVTGTGGPRKEGTGALVLSATNTYSGTTLVNAGVLRLGAAEVIPDGDEKGDLTVEAMLDMNGFSETINGVSGTGTVDTTVEGAAYLTVGAGDATATFNGVLANSVGSLALTKTGLGTLTLRGSVGNTYTGTTTFLQGTLVLAKTAGNAIGGDLVWGDSGVSQFCKWAGNEQIADTATLDFGTSGHMHLELLGHTETVARIIATTGFGVIENRQAETGIDSSGTFVVNGAADSTYSAYIRDNSGGSGAGVLRLVKDGTGTLTLGGTQTTYTGPTTVNSGTLTLEGAGLTGTASVEIGTEGLINLSGSGNNQLRGSWTIAGTLRVTTAAAHTLYGNVVLNNGTMDSTGGYLGNYGAYYAGANRTVTANGAGNTISGNGKLGIGAGKILTLNTPLAADALNITIEVGAGANGTAGGLTKTGDGTAALSNTNAYTGETRINGGTLKINGSNTGAGATTVNAGGTLGGTGVVAGVATVNSGGTLNPGTDEPGTLTLTGGLVLNDGAKIGFDLGMTSDLLRITAGTVTGAGSAGAEIVVGGATGLHGERTVIDWTGATASGVDVEDFGLTLPAGWSGEAHLSIIDTRLVIFGRQGTLLIVR